MDLVGVELALDAVDHARLFGEFGAAPVKRGSRCLLYAKLANLGILGKHLFMHCADVVQRLGKLGLHLVAELGSLRLPGHALFAAPCFACRCAPVGFCVAGNRLGASLCGIESTGVELGIDALGDGIGDAGSEQAFHDLVRRTIDASERKQKVGAVLAGQGAES